MMETNIDYDKVYVDLEKTLSPLLKFLENLDEPLLTEVSTLYSLVAVAQIYDKTVSVGLLERAKNMILNRPAGEEEDEPRFPFIT